MARRFAVVCLFGLLFIWCKVHLQELEVFLLKFLHEQFQRNQLTANTPTDVYWEQIPQQSVFTAFYKFKGFGCGGFKNPFSQQKFCTRPPCIPKLLRESLFLGTCLCASYKAGTNEGKTTKILLQSKVLCLWFNRKNPYFERKTM